MRDRLLRARRPCCRGGDGAAAVGERGVRRGDAVLDARVSASMCRRPCPPACTPRAASTACMPSPRASR
ncbi:MAG: hypothetical protein RLW42_22365, partial [Gammaproteobacteria bacterium]